MKTPVPGSNNGDWVIASIHLILLIKLFLLGGNIWWIVSDSQSSSQQSLSRIRLYDCSFSSDVVYFKLSGLMSLIGCWFFIGNKEVTLYLEKSRYESEITEESLRYFYLNKYQNRIEIFQTIFVSVRFMSIFINNVARHLKVEAHLCAHVLHIYIGQKGHDCQKASVFDLEIINCRVSGHIAPYLTFPNSFAKFRFENTDFDRVYFSSEHFTGLGSYVFDNCTSINAPHQSCQTFDSCNSNRSGPLCGVCEKGLVKSLFDQNCISVEKCHTWFIVLLYISCAVGYGLGLMVIDNIKGALLSSLKKFYQCIKRTILKKVKPNLNTQKSKNSEKSKSFKKETKKERSFKHLQNIFFMYKMQLCLKLSYLGKA